jgi:hypothetical protein
VLFQEHLHLPGNIRAEVLLGRGRVVESLLKLQGPHSLIIGKPGFILGLKPAMHKSNSPKGQGASRNCATTCDFVKR